MSKDGRTIRKIAWLGVALVIALVITLPVAWYVYFAWEVQYKLVYLKPLIIGVYGGVLFVLYRYLVKKLEATGDSNISSTSANTDTQRKRKDL